MAVLGFSSGAQNLESIGKAKPLQVSGGISMNQIFYQAAGVSARRDPYSFFLSGNVNFSLYGWSIPLSFAVSNQQTSFQQPFNQYSMHPSYKWITGHVGYTSMTFSSYTLGGHIFSGAGVDLAPEGKWKFSAMYGRLLKSVERDTSREDIVPAYRRMGYGFKAGYGDESNSAEIIIFHAADQLHSIAAIPDSLGIFPQENLVVSVGGMKTLFDHIVIKGELAQSWLTRDSRAEINEDASGLLQSARIFTPRVSTASYAAMKASISYHGAGYSLGGGYERVAPEYRTLGAYYFNNDLESFTLNATSAFASGKLSLSGTGGLQRDNLDKQKISTMRRVVGSMNVNYAPSQKMSVTISYSSFRTFTNIRSQFLAINQLTPYDNLDTLNFTQISRNASATGTYSLGKNKDRRQMINLSVTYQGAADSQGDNNAGSQFYNANAGYSMALAPQQVTLSAAFNANVNRSTIDTKTLGPTIALTRLFLDKKLRATISSAFNNSYAASRHTGVIVNGRLGASYIIQKKHSLMFSGVIVNRKNLVSTSARSVTEFTATLGYSYAFAVK